MMARLWHALVPGLLLLAGCGGLALYTVEGKVTFPDGKPVDGGTVEFRPDEPQPGQRNPSAEIQPDGSYKLQALPGDYQVIVVVPQRGGENMEGPPPQPVVHPKYRSYESSGLRCTVKPQTNDYPIQVERP